MALMSDEFVLQSSKCLLRVRCRDKAKHSRKLILAKTNFEHRCCQQWKTFRDKWNKVINSNEIQGWVSTTLQVVILLTATLSSFFANTGKHIKGKNQAAPFNLVMQEQGSSG